MQTITDQLHRVQGGRAPTAQPRQPSPQGGSGGGLLGTGMTAQDIMGARPADNRAFGNPSPFKTNTPSVDTPEWKPPDSMFQQMGM